MPIADWEPAEGEPMVDIEAGRIGIRDAVFRGLVSLTIGERLYPTGDWSVITDPIHP